MGTTAIEWTDLSWNPITGCTPISAGCKNCYAKRMAETRLKGRFGYSKENPFKLTFHENRLNEPFKWKKGKRIFVCSMGDLFHEDIPLMWLARVFEVIERTPGHTYIILTKRPERMRALCECYHPIVPANVWFGASVEEQNSADGRIKELVKIPASVRFISYEPALRPVDLSQWLGLEWGDVSEDWIDNREWFLSGYPRGLNWVIAGGESGPGARPAHPDWFRSVRDQCAAAEVPFMFKQWGQFAPGRGFHTFGGYARKVGRHYLDCKRGDKLICPDGHVPTSGGEAGKSYPMYCMNRVGKKAAGRLLDGVVHDEYPKGGINE